MAIPEYNEKEALENKMWNEAQQGIPCSDRWNGLRTQYEKLNE